MAVAIAFMPTSPGLRVLMSLKRNEKSWHSAFALIPSLRRRLSGRPVGAGLPANHAGPGQAVLTLAEVDRIHVHIVVAIAK